MTEITSKYADFEGLRTQALTLRRAGLSRRQIRDRLLMDNNDILNSLLEGEPAPEWTRTTGAVWSYAFSKAPTCTVASKADGAA
ncbi:hypothetical protein [Streptomyces sp. NPDC005181]|uniref:hypothetical protein n=1 Tax=Streptomyces sp. NPDC005181 TaxID=3156869 RepID=UPI0033B799C0